MKKRVILLPAICMALAACAAGADTDADGTQQQVKDPALTDVAVDSTKIEVKANSAQQAEATVSIAEFNALKAQVEALQEASDEEPSSGLNLGSMLLSLIIGAAGGTAAFFYLNSKKFDFQKKPTLQEEKPKTTTPVGKQKTQGSGMTVNERAAAEQKAKGQHSYEDYMPDHNSDGGKAKQTEPEKPKEQPKPQPKQQPKPADVHKRVFGNLSIPSQGMIVIADYELTHSSADQSFEFDINETRGTATYTFASDVLQSLISNLSDYEKFVEPFAFNSAATKVTVVSPGTLVHRQGYWQVEKLITISLS